MFLIAFYIPVRYVFGIMGMLGVMVAYMMRACLSIAITQMVKAPAHSNHFSVPKEDVCPSSEEVTTHGHSVTQNV